MERWKEFISLYKRPRTIETYKSAIKRFFKHVYGEQAELESSADRYFEEKRDYEADVKSFFVAIKDISAPKTVSMNLTVVKTFLIMNKVELSQSFWRILKTKTGNHAISEEIVPSKEQLRQILTHMNAKGKALYLTLVSSGMRIGEELELIRDDIDFETTPTKITIRAQIAKGGNKRITFISDEATEALKEWLKIREEYLASASAKSKVRPQYKKAFSGKPIDDPRIFPFRNVTAYSVWYNALNKTKLDGIDQTTRRSKIHPHVLRKFFRSQMGSVIPVDVTEALMGHEGYLTNVYRVYPNPEKTLAEFYRKGESAVTIFGGGVPAEIQSKMTEQTSTIQQLATMIAEMKARLDKYEQKYGFLDAISSDLKEMVRGYRKQKAEYEKEERIKQMHLKRAWSKI